VDEPRSLVNYEKRLNLVLDHIEANYDRPLSLTQLADLAHFSPYHFHRLFRAYTGEPPHVFVRRLRLQKAMTLMERPTRKNLAEIALDSGFAQSSDFSRAFREVYGYPPSKHRNGRVGEDSKIRQDLPNGSRYRFPRSDEPVEGDDFQVRIENLPAQRIAFVRVIGGQNPQRLMGGLDRLLKWGRQRGIYPGATLVATSPDNPEIVPAARYRIDLGMFVPITLKEGDRMSFATLPARRYAMVHAHGNIQKVDCAWTHLFANWLPASNYEPHDSPYLELFRNSDDSNGWSELDLDCCLPIRPLSRKP